jgi:hypothetical protein
MRVTRTLVTAVVAAAVVILAATTVLVFGPKAGADSVSGSNIMSVHELHRNYPNINDLPVQEIENPL